MSPKSKKSPPPCGEQTPDTNSLSNNSGKDKKKTGNVTIERANHDEGYLSVLNDTVRDKRVSRNARSLLTEILSRGEGWHWSIEGIAKTDNKSEGTVLKWVRELEKYGYLTRERERDENTGQLKKWHWIVRERPAENCPPTKNNGVGDDPPVKKASPGENNDNRINIPNRRNNYSISGEPPHKNCGVGNNGEKQSFGPYNNIRLSHEDLNQLKSQRPKDWDKCINCMSKYLHAHDKQPYPNPLPYLLSWEVHESSSPKKSSGPRPNSKHTHIANYDSDAFRKKAQGPIKYPARKSDKVDDERTNDD